MRVILFLTFLFSFHLVSKAQLEEKISIGGLGFIDVDFVLSADLNNDGSDEIITLTQDGIRVLENLGNLEYSEPITHEVDLGYIADAIAGDIDGDGWQDLVIAMNLYRYLDTGDTIFPPSSTLFIPPLPPLVSAQGRIILIRNLGSFNFATAQTITDSLAFIRDIETAQLDKDTELEIVTATSLGEDFFSNPYVLVTQIYNDMKSGVYVFDQLTNLGANQSNRIALTDTTVIPFDLAIGDLNLDQIDDISFINSDSIPGLQVGLIQSVAPMQFSEVDTLELTGEDVRFIDVHDMDADGMDDFVFSSNRGNFLAHVSYIPNQDGHISQEYSVIMDSYGYASSYLDFEIEDLNGDNLPDVLTSLHSIGGVLNLGDGQFSAPQTWKKRYCNGYSQYLIHRNMSPDYNNIIIWCEYDAGIVVLGDPTAEELYLDVVNPLEFMSIREALIQDFNFDNIPEIIVTGDNSPTPFILRWDDGLEVYNKEVLSPKEIGKYSLTAGDWDNDGDVDIASSGGYYGPVYLLYNNGEGIFTDTSTIVVFTYAQSGVQTIDFNMDGFQDLLVSFSYYQSQGRYKLRLNDGEGNFDSEIQSVLSHDLNSRPLIMDWNEDGYPDLVSYGDSSLSFMLNIEGEAFDSPQIIVDSLENHFRPFQFNLNNDQQPDLVFAKLRSYGNDTIDIYSVINGQGSDFEINVLLSGVVNKFLYHIFDVNQDGFADLIFNNLTNAELEYYLLGPAENGVYEPFCETSGYGVSLNSADLNNDWSEDLLGIDLGFEQVFWFYGDYSVITNTSKTSTESQLTVYPNPTQGLISFQLGTSHEELQLEIYNAQGIQFFNGTIKGSKSFNLEDLGLASGLYFIKVTSTESSFIQKIMYSN